MIRIIGLGIVDGDISMRGFEAVGKSKLAVFKTKETGTYALSQRIDIPHITLDEIYINSDDLDDVNAGVVSRIIELEAEHGDIAYLINGSGADDRTVAMLRDKGLDVELFPASAKEMTFDTFDTSYLAMSAYDLVNAPIFMPDTAYPLVVKDIDSRGLASDVKIILSKVFDDETNILLTTLDGIVNIPLYELDRQNEYNYFTALYIESGDFTKKKRHTFSDLWRIMVRLRDRETGCAWDKVQTHESIRKNVIEEAYELVNAIDNKDIDNIVEECGDILLQSVFHACIGEDTGEFDMGDMISGLCNKLVTRHTHIFGDTIATNSEEALKAWEAAKAKEKSQKTFTAKLEGIADGLPQLMRAEKAQKHASKRGLDFPNVDEAIAKIREELTEFLVASNEDKEMEAGDLLFAVVNVLRLSGIEGEVALRRSTNKFINRCKMVEKFANADGKKIEEIDAKAFDEYWEKAKKYEDR